MKKIIIFSALLITLLACEKSETQECSNVEFENPKGYLKTGTHRNYNNDLKLVFLYSSGKHVQTNYYLANQSEPIEQINYQYSNGRLASYSDSEMKILFSYDSNLRTGIVVESEDQSFIGTTELIYFNDQFQPIQRVIQLDGFNLNSTNYVWEEGNLTQLINNLDPDTIFYKYSSTKNPYRHCVVNSELGTYGVEFQSLNQFSESVNRRDGEIYITQLYIYSSSDSEVDSLAFSVNEDPLETHVIFERY